MKGAIDMRLYIAYTADKYELPCAVTNTGEQLANLYHIHPCNMWKLIKSGKAYKKAGVRFAKLDYDAGTEE